MNAFDSILRFEQTLTRAQRKENGAYQNHIRLKDAARAERDADVTIAEESGGRIMCCEFDFSKVSC